MASETTHPSLEQCLRHAERLPGSAAAHFNLGLAYTRRGRVERAERAYRDALELDPDLVEAWVNLGGVLLLKWDFEGAAAANREAIQRRDDLVLAHCNLGQASLYLGDGEGVVRSYRRVVELDPNHAAGRYFLAVGLLATGRVREAREELAHARRLGHSPAPEFLRALGQAEQRENSKVTNVATGLDAQAANGSKEK